MSEAFKSPLGVAAALVLAALNVAFATSAWHSLTDDRAVPVGDLAPAQTAAAAVAPRPYPVRPLAAFSQTLSRPVLFKSRKPFVAAVAPASGPASAPVPQPAPATLELHAGGIVLTPGKRQMFIVSKAQPQGIWVGEGDEIEGWTFVAIDGQGARVQRNDVVARVDLYP